MRSQHRGVSIKAEDLSFSYGDKTILDHASFVLDSTRRNCLVGKNGTGKSTLLRILARELHASGGTIKASNARYTVEYVPQVIPLMPGRMGALQFLLESSGAAGRLARLEFYHEHMSSPEVLQQFEEFLSTDDEAEIYASVATAREGLSSFVGLSPSEHNRPTQSLSGGQKTRLFILRALASQPELLLLDEPDSNLDREARTWLVAEIERYPDTILVVGHRVEFVDRIAERVLELSNRDHKVYIHTGSYSSFLDARAHGEELDDKRRLQVEKERRRLKAAIQGQLRLAARSARGAKRRKDSDKMAAKHKSSRAAQKHQARAATLRKRLGELAVVERPQSAELRMDLDPAHCGHNVMTIARLGKRYEKCLFRGFSLRVRKGEHLAVVGPNASGKTTLVKIVAGLVEPDEGEVQLGRGVVVGYLPQEQEGLPDMSVLEYFRRTVSMDITSLRRALHHYLFTEHEVLSNIQSLSAGQRVLLFLVQFALTHANLLLLDEPTNNLDLVSKERLTQSLTRYPGTTLVVSHDHSFLERLSIDKTLRLGGCAIRTEYGLAL